MSRVDPCQDQLTATSIGVLAGTLAAVAHEMMGHGSGCLAVGGRITLLTSIYFRCAGATALTDAAGPLGGLAFALIAVAALKYSSPSSWPRFFFWVSSLIGLGWFAGQAVYCAVLDKDDWAFVARSVRWAALWRPCATAVGVATYLWSARTLASYGDVRNAAGALVAAAAAAAAAGLLWARAPVQGAIEGASAVGLAPAVLLLLVARRRTAAVRLPPPSSRSWAWTSVAAVVYLLFLLGPARGLGSLS